MGKKIWLNSKAPAPQWVVWPLFILGWFGIMLIASDGDLEIAIIKSLFIFLIITIFS